MSYAALVSTLQARSRLLTAGAVAELVDAFPQASLHAGQVEALRQAYAVLWATPPRVLEAAGFAATLGKAAFFKASRGPLLGVTPEQLALLLRGGRGEALERLRLALTSTRAITLARSDELLAAESSA